MSSLNLAYYGLRDGCERKRADVSGAIPTVEPGGASAVQELSRWAKALVFDLDDTLLLTREVKWAHYGHRTD
jgi:hypothetical protein